MGCLKVVAYFAIAISSVVWITYPRYYTVTLESGGEDIIAEIFETREKDFVDFLFGMNYKVDEKSGVSPSFKLKKGKYDFKTFYRGYRTSGDYGNFNLNEDIIIAIKPEKIELKLGCDIDCGHYVENTWVSY